jgi:intracellular multiplication protein IcmE
MTTDFNETPGAPRYSKPAGGGALKAISSRPIFKLVALLTVVGGLAYAANSFYSRASKVEQSVLPTTVADVAAVPVTDTEVTPEYQRAVREQSQQRIAEAQGELSSAVPTPMQSQVMPPTMGTVEGEAVEPDLLKAFETSVQGRMTDAPSPVPQPSAPPISPEAVAALAATIRGQLEQVSRDWSPGPMNYLQTSAAEKYATVTPASAGAGAGAAAATSSASSKAAKLYVPLGAVHYGHMIMEANSDVPGPIMAEILSGPFAGGRLIGAFETQRNFLIIRFTKLSFRRLEIAVDILAVDPNTTLGAVVTEVDPRYFTRVILPAAGEFIRAFGETLSKDTSTVTVSGSGATSITTSTQAKPTTEDALYDGLEASADRVGQFLDDEASNTKRLVRVAVGTPMGLLFLKAVRSSDVQ